MKTQIINTLKARKKLIVKCWLDEMNLASPTPDYVEGELASDYINECFDRVIHFIGCIKLEQMDHLRFYENMDVTFTCKPSQLACVQIQSAGILAFYQILEHEKTKKPSWSNNDIELLKRYISNAIAFLVHQEINECASSCGQHFCPFTNKPLQSSAE